MNFFLRGEVFLRIACVSPSNVYNSYRHPQGVGRYDNASEI